MAGVTITLGGNFSKLDELNGKADKTAKGIKGAFSSNMGKAAFAGLATAATAAFASVVASVKSAVDAAGELSDMMARTGADGQKLFVLGQAFKNAGMAASQVPQALNKMQKALAGVNEDGERVTTRVFNDLGLSIEKLRGMDPAEAFRNIGEAIAGISDPAKRSAVAMEIFGRSGGEMLAVMRDTEAFSLAEKQVGGLGKTLADNAADMDKVSDAMQLMSVKFQQLGAEVAVALMPELDRIADWANEVDLASMGREIGVIAQFMLMLAENAATAAGALEKAYQYTPFGFIAKKLGENSEDAPGMALEPLDVGMGGFKKPGAKGTNEADTSKETEKEKKAREAAEKKAKAAEVTAKKKADAAAKEAAEIEASRAAAVEEWKLELAIAEAKEKGDEKRLAALKREKAIRAEIQRLESAGFAAAEARDPAKKKVDAEIAAKAAEESRSKAEDEMKRVADDLAGKREDIEQRRKSLKFESTIGAISSMQRVGGGGGAVGSGLDYQRQAQDLQRESNKLLAEIKEKLTRPVDS